MSVSLARKKGCSPETDFLKEKYLVYDWKYKTQCKGDLTVRKTHTHTHAKKQTNKNLTAIRIIQLLKNLVPEMRRKYKEVREL